MQGMDPCGCDGHLEAEFEDRISGSQNLEPLKEESRETDPDLAEWLLARSNDHEEQRLALADMEGEW